MKDKCEPAAEKSQTITKFLADTMTRSPEGGLSFPLISMIPMPKFPSPSLPCTHPTHDSALLTFISSGSSESSGSSSSRSRKSTTPVRSASADDPAFSGIRFRFHLSTPPQSSDSGISKRNTRVNSPELSIQKEYVRPPAVPASSKLDNTGRYIPLNNRRRKRVDYDTLSPPRIDRQSPVRVVTEHSSDSSEEEIVAPPPKTQKTKHTAERRQLKVCASCQSTKSPMWRDTEEGIPLCNACGIRYKRYHFMCPYCRYVPRKDEKAWKSCKLCGHRLRCQ